MPPRLASRLVEWAAADAVRDHLLGDLEEAYRARLVSRGRLSARLWYWKQALRCIMLHRELGSRPVHKSPVGWHHVLQDLRYAVRAAVRTPAVSLVVVVTLGLGIGSTTTMFSISQAILSDLPVDRPDELVMVSRANLVTGVQHLPALADEFLIWNDEQTALADIAAMSRGMMQISDGVSRPQRLEGTEISPVGLELLGVTPAIGRSFTAVDASPGAPSVVLIGHELWRDRYGSDPAVLGKTVRVDGIVRTIVGVMPEGFGFPTLVHLWTPLRVDPAMEWGSGPTYEVFGRLRQGVTIDAAKSEFALFGRRAAQSHPETNRNISVQVLPYTDQFVGSDARLLLFTMLTVVSFVLLIACANVANVLLARAASRGREVAIRQALGSGRGRLLVQLLTETAALSVLGGVLGVAIAYGAMAWFDRTISGSIERFWIDLSVDVTALVFAAGLVMVATIAAGIMPALQASAVHVGDVLKDDARGATSFRIGRVSRGLVVAELALACALLTLSGLMVMGVINLAFYDKAFDPEGVLTARVDLEPFDYPDDMGRRTFHETLETTLARQPAIASATLTSMLPGASASMWRFTLDGEEYGEDAVLPTAQLRAVSPSFFETFTVALRAGRLIEARDRVDAPTVVVINTVFAQRFGGDDLVGRRLRIGGQDATPAYEIVGIVDDGGTATQEGQGVPGFFVPLAQRPAATIQIALRTRGDPVLAIEPMLETIAALDPNLAVTEVATLPQVLHDLHTPERTFGILFGAFGAAALLLAAVGLYGVVSFTVQRRTQEMGIRRALGARATHVAWLTLRSTLVQLGLGLSIGSGLAYLIAPAMAELFFGADPHDTTVFLTVPLILGVTTLCATMLPTRRATRVDPMFALRYE